MIFETLDRIGPFVVVCSQSASIPAKKRRILVRCVNCNATQEMLASSLSDKRLFEQCVCSRCRPRNGNPHTWATRAKFEELKMAMEKDLAEAQAAVRETLAQLRTVLEERDKACRERDSHQQRVARLEEAIVTSLGQRLEPCMSRHPVTVVMAAGSLIAKIGEAIGCEFTDGDDLLEAVKGLVRERDEARAEVEQMQNRCAHVRGCLDQAIAERDEARAEVEKLSESAKAAWEAESVMREQRDRYYAEWKQERQEVERLRRGEECHVARPGEGTYECRHDNRCAACRLRSAEWRAQNAYRRGAEAMREACIGTACAQDLDHDAQDRMEERLRALPIPEET